MALLTVDGLVTQFRSPEGTWFNAVDGATLEVGRGELVGLVGESGCGKSLTLRSIINVLPRGARIAAGEIIFDDKSITRRRRRRSRGNEIAMILQDPMTALNPVLTVGHQILETLRETRGLRGRVARERAIELLRLVNVPDPQHRLKAYPHELSGGLAQRVVIAIALSTEPRILLADEPTTALDVTVQAQILSLLMDLQRKLDMSMLLVTHDLGVVAQTCSRVSVMYGGRVVEEGPARTLFESPRHPYTVGLLASMPRLDAPLQAARLPSISGSPPNLASPPPGCPFAPRCPIASEECTLGRIPMFQVGTNHKAACLKHEMVSRATVSFGALDAAG
jgi:peptide/nickel transport system ATP-binding protein